MQETFKIAITGDTVLTRRISVHHRPDFLSLIEILRSADVAYTHLETVLHNYDGPEVYPAAEGGWTWMRSPTFAAEELKWAGVDIVSHASNHALDYSYGGLFSTWELLDRAGIVYAGTGRNLGEARSPAYLDTAKGRVALISMCSTFVGWARAGETRRDMKGRPGLNPLRFYYHIDKETVDLLNQLAVRLGWSVVHKESTWILSPAGLENTVFRFVETGNPGVVTVASEDDVEGNLNAIRDARRSADVVLVHLHNHEWDTIQGLGVPSQFARTFAQQAIDAGADVFIGQGSHSSLRGIQMYKNKPIFYDPGDFIRMSSSVTKLPSDSYWNPRYGAQLQRWEATPADAFDVRKAQPGMLNPPGGIPGPVKGAVIAVVALNEDYALNEIKLYPVIHTYGSRPKFGIPLAADADSAKTIIDYLAKLSAPFHTAIEFKDGIGLVRIK
jgi:poly-gamma-glutamate synthesis protein (capsule biosynthesis protein)